MAFGTTNMPVADTLVTHMDNSIIQKVCAWRMRGLQKQLVCTFNSLNQAVPAESGSSFTSFKVDIRCRGQRRTSDKRGLQDKELRHGCAELVSAM